MVTPASAFAYDKAVGAVVASVQGRPGSERAAQTLRKLARDESLKARLEADQIGRAHV